jgi:hypothetical protein
MAQRFASVRVLIRRIHRIRGSFCEFRRFAGFAPSPVV